MRGSFGRAQVLLDVACLVFVARPVVPMAAWVELKRMLSGTT
jgi:hypothetical protein